MTGVIGARRLQLRAHGYLPIPLFGKVPPLKQWQNYTVISRDMIELWNKVWPDAINTGILTRLTPALDIDIRNEEAARAVENLARDRFEERGWFLVRIGQPPKRAIIFRTSSSFYATVSNSSSTASTQRRTSFINGSVANHGEFDVMNCPTSARRKHSS
jgi:Bifunctional DNA primase/polymerase, N-terminal